MVELIEKRMKELKKQLETMTRNQLAEFIKKKNVILDGKFEDLTKKQIIAKTVHYIEQVEFWTEYYS